MSRTGVAGRGAGLLRNKGLPTGMAHDAKTKDEASIGMSIPEQDRFRLLVEAVTDYAIYMLDASGYVASWNAGAERAKGYTREEILGHHFSRFYTPDDRQNGLPQRALQRAASEGRFEGEGWRVRKNGTRMWAHVVIDPIRDADGGLIGYAKITREITERMRAQTELEKTREAFHQSQKMESLGQLSGGIAHDFNNLLMAVLSSLEMLRKRMPDDPKLIQLLDNAVQGAERGASLTQRMLSFARRQSLDPKAVNIPELVSGLKSLLERTIGPSVTIDTRVEGSVRPAHADANQLELAIINLAVNARDAMPSGGAITVAVREQVVTEGEDLAAGPYVVVALVDTGEGMDDETLARATEPFFTTKGIGRGTGLGLSMVHGFAEQLSGRLKLTSRAGEGTTAEIWIPVATGEIERPTMAEAGNDPSANASRPLVVLAVDDDALVQMNTVAMLEDLGHRVVEAANGSEALDAIRAHPDIDLVVTDYAMPKMTGRDLAIAIAQERPNLPVVLATGYADLPPGEAIDVERLPKPFGQNELERAIKRALKR
jgi:PAS domain S-box-containing protein